jgi:HSP20 family molecular chaperone IbpA
MAAETTLAQDGAEVSPPEHTRGGIYFRPNVDIYELPDELVVSADMPGAKSDQIDIQFEDGSLTIHARVDDRQQSQGPFLRKEYGVGDYYRTFRVSEHIDASRISAEYAAGVLTLHLPKVEAVKPRKIQVQSK